MNRSDTLSVHAGLLTLEGTDALTFAHAQFTSDVLSLQTGHWQWSAWLDARGRVRYLFHLARTHDDVLVACLRGGDAAVMAQQLGRYVFRSRVTVAARPPALPGGGPSCPAYAIEQRSDALVFGFGERSLVVPATAEDDGAWRLEAIRHGEPWLPDACLDTFLPPALGLRRLGAINLKKGCFPGQEIAARLHYLGGHKNALVHLRAPEPFMTGRMTLEAPAANQAAEAMSIDVLDAVDAGDGHEALAVAHERVVARLDGASLEHVHGITLVKRFDA